MRVKHGMISLRDIASFVNEHREDEDALNPQTPLGREYCSPAIADGALVLAH